MAVVDADLLFAQLDELGEDAVRKRLASNAVYGGDKKELVQEWLQRKERERSEASQSEQIAIARRASEAAERAASAAERDAAAAERAATAAERSSRNATTAKQISMALMIVTAIGILVAAFAR